MVIDSTTAVFTPSFFLIPGAFAATCKPNLDCHSSPGHCIVESFIPPSSENAYIPGL